MEEASKYLYPKKNSKRETLNIRPRDVERDRFMHDLHLKEMEEEGVVFSPPKTRAECPPFRPCPYVSCRYHLYLEVKENDRIRLNFSGIPLEEMPWTCALDEAAKQSGEPKPMPLDSIGERMGLTRERVRQIEKDALDKLARTGMDLRDLLLDDGEDIDYSYQLKF